MPECSLAAPALIDMLPACIASPSAPAPGEDGYVLECVADTGAGRNISSKKEFARQGVPKGVLAQAQGPASSNVTFQTGGGERVCDVSLGITSPMLGQVECYALQDSPFAISLGGHVERGNTFVLGNIGIRRTS